MQADVDPILRGAGRLKVGIEQGLKHLIKNAQGDLHEYLTAAFTDLEATTTSHCRRYSGSIHGAVTHIADGLRALVETIEGLGRLFFVDIGFRCQQFRFNKRLFFCSKSDIHLFVFLCLLSLLITRNGLFFVVQQIEGCGRSLQTKILSSYKLVVVEHLLYSKNLGGGCEVP